MNKERIGIDADDVLAAHIEAFIEHSNDVYGTNYTLEDYREQWGEMWGVDHEEVEARALKFHTPEIVGNFGVIEDAAFALNSLKKRYDLVIVTARPRRIVDTTLEWVERNLPDIFSDVHFVPIWEPGNTITKADICRQIGADYLIDDLIRHCNIAAEGGIQPILFRRINWKQPGKPHEKVVQVKDWKGVLEYFDAAA